MEDPSSETSDAGERAILLLLAALSAVVAVTCASEGGFGSRLESPPTAAAAAAGPAIAPSASSETPASPAKPERAGDAGTSARAMAPESLGRFFGALSELEQKKRRQAVRILWLGDSHTAADFWTGVVRRALVERFGNGGPGFLRIGVQPYRHDQVKVGREGRFRIHPDPPARRAPQGDGVFGLGGMRVVAEVGARATFEVQPEAIAGQACFEVWFRLPAGSNLRIELGKQVLSVGAQGPFERVPDSSILRARVEGTAGAPLVVTATAGVPELFGVVAEGTEPGVVLDAVGIDGARLATPLAWAEEPFVAEVRARAPALYVVAYGTNEVFDALRVDRYADQLKNLVGRLRRGAPDADCLIVGPPDAASREGGSEPRVAEIDRVEQKAALELGCAYLSAYALMGGEGSFTRFMSETPRLARPDRIHLTPKGYEVLGAATAKELLARYDAFKAGGR